MYLTFMSLRCSIMKIRSSTVSTHSSDIFEKEEIVNLVGFEKTNFFKQ